VLNRCLKEFTLPFRKSSTSRWKRWCEWQSSLTLLLGWRGKVRTMATGKTGENIYQLPETSKSAILWRRQFAWLGHRVEQYFMINCIPKAEKMDTTMVHLEGRTLNWYHCGNLKYWWWRDNHFLVDFRRNLWRIHTKCLMGLK